MDKYRGSALSTLAVAMLFGLLVNAEAADNTATGNTASTLGVQIVLPPVYESTIASLGALATGGAAALKTYRADARATAIRAALSKALLAAAGHPVTTISLDKTDTDATIGELALLCAPRQNFIASSVSLNYLSTLVQNINAVSALPTAPTDIASALGLLFASSGYAVNDKVNADPQSEADLGKTALANCQKDLTAYAKDYYGTEMPAAPHPAAASLAPGAVVAGVDMFAFLGPVGTLIDTFLSILQPVLIDASKIVDQARRQQAIQNALEQNEDKISTTGQQLAAAVDNYAAASRHGLVGLFVEQLVAIREMPIDLSAVADCKSLVPTNRLPSGAPDAAFVGCWAAAWGKLQPAVDSLKTTADSYDLLADAESLNVTASKRFATIMANYKAIKAGNPVTDTILNEMAEFITFANDIANAASKSNVAALKAAAAKAEK